MVHDSCPQIKKLGWCSNLSPDPIGEGSSQQKIVSDFPVLICLQMFGTTYHIFTYVTILKNSNFHGFSQDMPLIIPSSRLDGAPEPVLAKGEVGMLSWQRHDGVIQQEHPAA